MPYIHTVPYDDADGMLRRDYDAAIQRAGKVFNVVGIQSLHPRVLRASIALYQTLMMGEGALAPVDARIAGGGGLARERLPLLNQSARRRSARGAGGGWSRCATIAGGDGRLPAG